MLLHVKLYLFHVVANAGLFFLILGKEIGKLQGTGYDGYVYDMCVDGDTLIMTADSQVKFFTLQ